MATVNLGSIKFKWKGTYAGGTAYTIDDVVSYNGSSYICIQASTGNLPTDTAYFEQMSSAGTNGTDGTDLTTTLTTQGDILYRDASGLQRLGAGTSGQALITQGTGANPIWGSAGGIKQVISTNFTGMVSSSSGTFADVTGFSATITPSSTSSKILITVDCHFGGSADSYPAIKLLRGSTEIFSGVNGTGSQINCFLGYTRVDTPDQLLVQNRTVLDSPNTTSATTYKIQFASPYSNYQTYINRTSNLANNTYTQSKTSGITLMEVTV